MNVQISSAAGALRGARAAAGARMKKKPKKKVKAHGSNSDVMLGPDVDEVEDLDYEMSEEEQGETESDDTDSLPDSDMSSTPSRNLDGRRTSENNLGQPAPDEEAAGDTEELMMGAVLRHAVVSKKVYQWYFNRMHRSERDRQYSQGDMSLISVMPSVDAASLSGYSMHGLKRPSKWRLFCSMWHNRTFLMLPTIHPRHIIAVIWGVLMLLVDATYSAFLVPLSAAFCFRPGLWWCEITELIAGPIFLLNLILGFHIGFVITFNLRRLYITQPGLVARVYITHGGFWLDIMAVTSFIVALAGYMLDTSAASRVVLRLLLLFRLVRVHRLLTVMFMASVSARSGHDSASISSSFGLYTLTLLFTAAFFVNGFACLFYAVADIEGLENSWVGRYNSSFGLTSTPPMQIINASSYRHWQLSMYYVTTTLVTVGYGDITPATTQEQLLAVFMMLTAACMFAVLISSISEALSSMTADARTGSTMRKKLTTVLQWMADRNLPAKERNNILSFYSGAWRQHQKDHASELKIYEELPSVLRARVTMARLHKLLLSSVQLPSRREPGTLKDWPLQAAHVQLLAERFVPLELMAGQNLFVEGSDADSVYLLESGRLEVLQHQHPRHKFDILQSSAITKETKKETKEETKEVTKEETTEETKKNEEVTAVWIGLSSVLSFYEVHVARKRPMCVRAVDSSKLWRIELESLKPVLRTQLEFRKLLLKLFQHQMLQALRSQVNGRRPTMNDHTTPSAPGPDSFKWNEFHAFMHIPPNTPDSEARLHWYGQWIHQLEQAKPSQLVDLLSEIMAESPIGTQMHDAFTAVLVAGNSIRTKSLQPTLLPSTSSGPKTSVHRRKNSATSADA